MLYCLMFFFAFSRLHIYRTWVISETQSVFVYSMLRHHFQMVLDNIRIFATAMLAC